MKFLKKNYELFIFFAIAIVVNLGVLTRKGVIAFRHDWNLPMDAEGLRLMFYGVFDYFKDVQMGTTPFYPTDVLYRLGMGSLGFIGVTGEWVSKGIVVISMFLAGYFMFLFVKYLKNDTKGPLMAGVFYMLTPVMYNKIIAGHIYYILSYALVPLFLMTLLLSIRHSVKKKRWAHLLFSSLLFVIIGAQIQFFLMTALIVAIYFFALKGKEKLTLIKHFFLLASFLSFRI